MTSKRPREEVKARAGLPNAMYSYCRVVGCRTPARAGTADGLDMRYCRSHADHFQRHGDVLQGSFPAAILNPYRRAAFDWLTAHPDDVYVKNAIERIRQLYRRAGSAEEAFRLRGLKPKERAKVAWARLRKAEVDPRLPLAAWLAVEMAVKDDPRSVTKVEFKRVQAAKLVHRLASGTHKQWTQAKPDPSWPGRKVDYVQALHWYPKSRGRVLRHIGEDLERAAELVAQAHFPAIIAFKREREIAGKLPKRPHPARGVGVRRRRDGD
jgi:hypothetical protein